MQSDGALAATARVHGSLGSCSNMSIGGFCLEGCVIPEGIFFVLPVRKQSLFYASLM